jgi:hypothetical protein
MDILAIHMDSAAIWTQLTSDQLEQGGLTGSAGAHNGGDASSGDVDIDPIKYHPLPT